MCPAQSEHTASDRKKPTPAKESPPSLAEKIELASFLLKVGGLALRETSIIYSPPLGERDEYGPVSPCPVNLQVTTCFTEYLLCARDGARPHSVILNTLNHLINTITPT